MSPFHNPNRQVSSIRQALAQDKKPLGLFLGAGCPLSIKNNTSETQKPLIPDIVGLTKIVCERMESSHKMKKPFEVLLEHFNIDEHKNTNIEDILSHIRSLRVVAGKDSVRGLTAENLDSLDQEVCSIIVMVMKEELPENATAYHRIATWIGATQRSIPVELFTTNYDLLLEQALERQRVPYFDGFVGSYRAFFDPYAMEEDKLPPRWSRLWKLHGSINWYLDNSGLVYRSLNDAIGQRRVIHPSHLKYEQSRKMPYLAMIDRLRAFLKEPSPFLIVCGYSFRDDHLNEVLVQGLEGNPNGVVFALIYKSLKDYPKAISLAEKRPNLNILAEDEAVIGTRRAGWTEKQDLSDFDRSPGVEWVLKEKQGGEGLRQSHFKLGDFTAFGDFLLDITGVKEDTKSAK
ncbi:SIR2 family protein [candidate division LCP-89 bacterium B3_LCP]|uniref:SIR2 family protein n=1 Tax=candidate division LCP-89 bacterium B3_LCP TaxID=2012998 RepID=A0A532UVY6_UNCL8|nr:MAG: SIR2 family protein [candidate division LCP-89 bacterium B3_LCP]